MNRAFRPLLFAAVFLSAVASCGASPPRDPVAAWQEEGADVERTESALSPGTYYQSPAWPTTDIATFNYTCGGLAWSIVQPVRQLQSYGTVWSDALLPWTGSSFASYNIAWLECPNAFAMTMDQPQSVIYSTAQASCPMYAHLANGPRQWVANVKVPTYGLQYRPAWYTGAPTGGANGVWQVDIQAPATSGAGLADWGTGYGLAACTVGGHLGVYLR